MTTTPDRNVLRLSIVLELGQDGDAAFWPAIDLALHEFQRRNRQHASLETMQFTLTAPGAIGVTVATCMAEGDDLLERPGGPDSMAARAAARVTAPRLSWGEMLLRHDKGRYEVLSGEVALPGTGGRTLRYLLWTEWGGRSWPWKIQRVDTAPLHPGSHELDQTTTDLGAMANDALARAFAETDLRQRFDAQVGTREVRDAAPSEA